MPDLGQRRNRGGRASLGQHGPCRNGANGDCAGRRAWALFGLERKADNAVSNTRHTIE
jgi:hypothetical protein